MAPSRPVEQLTTSSQSGTFYFAYGSNLSPYQMALRCQHSRSSSGPVAIARLDHHAWIICERGYANVVAVPPDAEINHDHDHDHSVWGVIYNMTAQDEATLDLYEGHNQSRNPEPTPNPDPGSQHIKTHLQGGWDYNKHYLPMTVAKWLQDPRQYGVSDAPGGQSISSTAIRALVYVDELRTTPGVIVYEYIGRMNRALDESIKLGLPSAWVDAVVRRYIPDRDTVAAEGYIGTNEGYVEDDPVQTSLAPISTQGVVAQK